MKNWLFAFWILMVFVSCENLQNIDNQKDSKLFDLSEYRSVLNQDKVFTPEEGMKLIDSIYQMRENSKKWESDFYTKFRTLDSNTIVRVFQDSIDYYQNKSRSFSFHFNSLIFEMADYCGITIDRIEYPGWLTRYATFLLVYNKGKLIGIDKIAEGTQVMIRELDVRKQMRSKIINDSSLLVETINWRFEEDKKINQIDTLARLVTFGFSGKLRTDTLYFATKPFEKIHFEKERDPKTGIIETKRFLFFKDN